MTSLYIIYGTMSSQNNTGNQISPVPSNVCIFISSFLQNFMAFLLIDWYKEKCFCVKNNIQQMDFMCRLCLIQNKNNMRKFFFKGTEYPGLIILSLFSKNSLTTFLPKTRLLYILVYNFMYIVYLSLPGYIFSWPIYWKIEK